MNTARIQPRDKNSARRHETKLQSSQLRIEPDRYNLQFKMKILACQGQNDAARITDGGGRVAAIGYGSPVAVFCFGVNLTGSIEDTQLRDRAV